MKLEKKKKKQYENKINKEEERQEKVQVEVINSLENPITTSSNFIYTDEKPKCHGNVK